MTVICFPPPFSNLEYKKKYGEEHGSCQAGIAGFFTEVGNGTFDEKFSFADGLSSCFAMYTRKELDTYNMPFAAINVVNIFHFIMF